MKKEYCEVRGCRAVRFGRGLLCLLSSLLLADDRLPVVTRDVVILDSVPEIRTTTGYIASTINL